MKPTRVPQSVIMLDQLANEKLVNELSIALVDALNQAILAKPPATYSNPTMMVGICHFVRVALTATIGHTQAQAAERGESEGSLAQMDTSMRQHLLDYLHTTLTPSPETARETQHARDLHNQQRNPSHRQH